MSSLINASTTAGLVLTSDTSGSLALQTAGTTAVTIATSGFVGVGTTTPTDTNGFSQALDLNGTSGAAFYARTAGSGTNVTTFGNYGTDGYISNNAAGNIRFSNAGSERMRITSAGNVLIGQTTAPSSGTLLTSNGVQYNYGTSGGGLIQTPNGTGLSFYTYTGSMGSETYTRRMDIDSSGNLLVGTTSASGYKLNVQAGGSGAVTCFDLGAGNIDIVGGALATNVGYIGMGGSHSLAFTRSGTTESMRIDSSGNLLVGVTTPDTTISSQTKQTVLNGIAIKGGTYDVAMLQNGVYGNWDAYRVYNASNVGVYLNNGSTSWTATSDSRLKTITGTYTNALADVAQIQAVKFTWKADQQNTPQVGVLAQSVQAVVPEAISQSKIIDGDETEYLGVRYTELIPLLIASIQELQAKLKTAGVAGF